ncbi:hypothetical protein F4782DRAFT_524344 [Xylaria castorea]|nr:hypothetical protein F4782DRAFT_524344 [Xylaria castorea]
MFPLHECQHHPILLCVQLQTKLPTNNIMEPDEEKSWLFEESYASERSGTSKKSIVRVVTLTKIYFIVLHAIIIALIGVLLIVMVSAGHSRTATAAQSWSPVQQHVEYELQREYASEDTHSIFSGPPTPEQDHAWDELEKPSFFRVTREELERAGSSFDNIAELTDGGYVATLGVYHELHCVRQLRFYLSKEKYYPNLTQVQADYLQHHLDHCLEALRHVVMCHGNTALRSFAWVDPSAQLPKAQSNSNMSCVKWSSIYEWSQSRMVPYNPSLVRPLGK